MPRLLVCRECKTIETLPLFDGPPQEEAYDPLLNTLVARHVTKHGEKDDCAALLVASEDPCNCGEKTVVNSQGAKTMNGFHSLGRHTFWEGHKDDVLKGLQERWTGFHPEFYATVDTFKEDAARCYNLHRRPKGTDCIDWRADNRRLTNDKRAADKHIYLCDFCVVKSTVDVSIRRAAGLYDKMPGEID